MSRATHFGYQRVISRFWVQGSGGVIVGAPKGWHIINPMMGAPRGM